MNPNSVLRIQRGVLSSSPGYTEEELAVISLRCGIYTMHEARDAFGSTINKVPEQKKAGENRE